MKTIMIALIGALLVLGTQTQCTTLTTDDKQFLVEAGTDIALAVVLTKAPQFEPYAAAVAEVLRTKNLEPDSLDRTLAQLIETQVAPEDRADVEAVVAVISRQYRAYHARKVTVTPEDFANSIALQIEEPQPGGDGKK